MNAYHTVFRKSLRGNHCIKRFTGAIARSFQARVKELWPNAFFFTAHIIMWKSSENQVHVGLFSKTVYSLPMLMQAHQVGIQCKLVLEASVFTTITLWIFIEGIKCIQNHHFCGAIKCCTMRDAGQEFQRFFQIACRQIS